MFQVGSRVRDGEGFRATVRYIGPVAAAKNKEEIWLGVEWDDKTRGKHDGSCVDDKGDLVRYFTCAYGAGSFVKQAKVNAGRSLKDALSERYVTLDAPTITTETDTALPDAFFVTSKGNQKSIEFVGEEKIRKHQQLSTINKFAVRNDTVSSVGDNLREVIGHMVEADLQDNLLWQWSEVAKLGLEMPQLQSLLLHGNKMEPVTDIIAQSLPSGCFVQLQVLALNNCNLASWAQLQLLEPHFPHLNELYVANNHFTDLPTDAQDTDCVSGFLQLRILDVSMCGLSNWNQIQAFGKLLQLQELVLDGNESLSQVNPPVPETFATLYRMSLSGTGLGEWRDIDTLSQYPLQLLRITNIPLFSQRGASEVRPLVIARIPQLQVLNASRIGARERDDSEKTYLRMILREKDTLSSSSATVTAAGTDQDMPMPPSAPAGEKFSLLDTHLTQLHPQYPRLFARFGADVTATVKAAAGVTMASELIAITFKNLSFGSNGTLEPITKKLPRSMAIGKIRLLVKQLFGLEPRLQQLALRVYKDSVPTLLEDDMSSLMYYGAIDGAEIFVNEDKA